MNSEKMDSQTKKRKVDDVSSVRGYIHTTNEVKKAMKSETRFFDGTVQISDHEFARFVSFSPEKIDTFLSAQTMKSPVKLNNVRLTPRDGKKEVTFNHTSTIEICSRLDFSRRTEVKPPPAPYKNINEITQPKMMVSSRLNIFLPE